MIQILGAVGHPLFVLKTAKARVHHAEDHPSIHPRSKPSRRPAWTPLAMLELIPIAASLLGELLVSFVVRPS
ncbi:uncharacterized protein BDW47DRAFT_107226 [Aspergillus candidus]|uniref:Uncharacterized protein n=1 Tax=Aspergillus candidus TaxID=41067 RepID=A0A2I2F9J3_ASPCN|nr:hypothetical protein BDW47DRAFT_107226 [Aspergillus candidus]PLB37275.1 hypothetical protein BDW47DRAFT_107226 [Aspergillus candidus]